VNVAGLVGGEHVITIENGFEECGCSAFCPLCKKVKEIGKAGLIWVGERFYKTPDQFMSEGREMGFSRRVKSIPRGFKVGETWVMIAHPKTMREPIPVEELDPDHRGELFNGVEMRYVPAIFTLWRPTRVEKIVKESGRDSEEVKEMIEKGITPVFVPDDDPDHAGTVYDKADEEEVEETVTAG
jgi:hypothetical protein